MRRREIKTGITLDIPWAGEESYESRTFTKIRSEADAYSKVPLIFRAIRFRCNSLTRVPCYVYSGKTILEDGYEFEEQLPLHDLLWLSEAAILLRGFSPLLKLQNGFGVGKGLQWLNPFTVEMQYVGKELELWQYIKETGERFPKNQPYWTLEDFLFLRDFHPLSDIGPGVSATAVALGDGKTLASVTKFLDNFFSYDALPVVMVTAKSAGKGEGQRIEDTIRNKLRSLKNDLLRVIGFGGEDVKIEKLTSDLKNFDFDKVDNHSIQNISWAFDIPKTILTADSANYATAETERRIFTEGTIIPRCKFYESMLNPFLDEYGQRIEFAPEELPEMQEDEKERAASLKSLIDSGVPLLAALDMLGYDLSEEAKALIEKEEKAKEERKKNPPPIPGAQPQQPNQQPAQPPEQQPPNGEEKAEMGKWLRKSLNSFKAGKGADVEFESSILPEETRVLIAKSLLIATSEDEIRDAFKIGSRHSASDMAIIGKIHEMGGQLQEHALALGHGEEKKPKMDTICPATVIKQ